MFPRGPCVVFLPHGGNAAAGTSVRSDLTSGIGCAVQVLAGGSSTLCVKDGAVAIDLRPQLRGVWVHARTHAGGRLTVSAAGGATMGEVNAALAPYNAAASVPPSPAPSPCTPFRGGGGGGGGGMMPSCAFGPCVCASSSALPVRTCAPRAMSAACASGTRGRLPRAGLRAGPPRWRGYAEPDWGRICTHLRVSTI